MPRLQASRVIAVSYLLHRVAVPGEESFAITKFPQMLADEIENWAFTKVLQETQGSWMRILNKMLC